MHATCVVVGEAGVLLRGEAGAGKSSLALALIERATLRGGFAALVGDDRVRLARCHGRVVARPHPAIAGRIEIRGHGIVAVESVEACVLRLVVDLACPMRRMARPRSSASPCPRSGSTARCARPASHPAWCSRNGHWPGSACLRSRTRRFPSTGPARPRSAVLTCVA